MQNVNIFVFVLTILFKCSCREVSMTMICSQAKMFPYFNARHANFERKLSNHSCFYLIFMFFSWRYLYLYLQLPQAKSRKNLSLLAVPWINFYSSNRAAAVSAAMPRMVTLVVTITKSWNVSSWHFFNRFDKILNDSDGHTGGHQLKNVSSLSVTSIPTFRAD